MISWLRQNLKDVIFPSASVVAVTVMYIFSAGRTSEAFERRLSTVERAIIEMQNGHREIAKSLEDVKFSVRELVTEQRLLHKELRDQGR